MERAAFSITDYREACDDYTRYWRTPNGASIPLEASSSPSETA